MKIEHVALWTHQLEAQKEFYTRFFGGSAGERYENPAHGFAAYFITFEDGARLEIMQMTGVPANANSLEQQAVGWIHIAFSVGSREKVDALTNQLRIAGYRVTDEPQATDDGYYASFILDPDNNRLEITV
jgi:lactoylglutathione lyase